MKQDVSTSILSARKALAQALVEYATFSDIGAAFDSIGSSLAGGFSDFFGGISDFFGGFGGGYDPGSYDPGYNPAGAPVVLDLSGKGINITALSSSNVYYDMAGDGYQHRTAWAGAGNALLVFDTNNDGKITQRNQIVFTEWDPTATSDMQALRDVFDTNHYGKLDASDAKFSQFKLLVTNADGTQTLAQAANDNERFYSPVTVRRSHGSCLRHPETGPIYDCSFI